MNRFTDFILYVSAGFVCLMALLLVSNVAIEVLSSKRTELLTLGISSIAVSYILGRFIRWIYDGRMAFGEMERLEEEKERLRVELSERDEEIRRLRDNLHYASTRRWA